MRSVDKVDESYATEHTDPNESIIRTSDIPELLEFDKSFETDDFKNKIKYQNNGSTITDNYVDHVEDLQKKNDKQFETKKEIDVPKTCVASNEMEKYIEEKGEDDIDKSRVKLKGINRNAESRKSKRRIKIEPQAPVSKVTSKTETKENFPKTKENKEELVNILLLVALVIFLWLISDTISIYPVVETDIGPRIPASPSSVLEGYVQLSGLAEM